MAIKTLQTHEDETTELQEHLAEVARWQRDERARCLLSRWELQGDPEAVELALAG